MEMFRRVELERKEREGEIGLNDRTIKKTFCGVCVCMCVCV